MSTPFKYLPFMSGAYSTAPGLKLTAKEPLPQDRFIFQIDDHYPIYLQNKQDCRQEDIHKYYLESEPLKATMQAVNKYMVAKLVEEHPDHFVQSDKVLFNSLANDEIQIGGDWIATQNTNYISLFDALCSQVQEDVAVFQLTRDFDYLAAIHLCAPNHWSPAEKIGRPFDQIHQPVAGMDQTIRHYRKILESIVYKKGPFTRFAWGLGSDDRLNHHPQPPPGEDKTKWEGRFLSEEASLVYVGKEASPINARKEASPAYAGKEASPAYAGKEASPAYAGKEPSPVYIRVERQNLVGFPEANAFLFTIRTYFYEVESLSTNERQQLWQAVRSMTPESLKYKGLLEFARVHAAAPKI